MWTYQKSKIYDRYNNKLSNNVPFLAFVLPWKPFISSSLWYRISDTGNWCWRHLCTHRLFGHGPWETREVRDKKSKRIICQRRIIRERLRQQAQTGVFYSGFNEKNFLNIKQNLGLGLHMNGDKGSEYERSEYRKAVPLNTPNFWEQTIFPRMEDLFCRFLQVVRPRWKTWLYVLYQGGRHSIETWLWPQDEVGYGFSPPSRCLHPYLPILKPK